MKKILMLLMAITVLLTFAACGEDNESKTEPTEHKHSYRSEVTTPATCEKEGVATLTCDCGDSYTEKIYATGHDWSDWLEGDAPTYTAKGNELRGCANCNATESRDLPQLSLEDEVKDYPDMLHTLGYFSSVDNLTAVSIFDWATSHMEPVSETKDMENFIFSYTYSIEKLDALTVSYFGKTWDYSTMEIVGTPGSIEYRCNAAEGTATVVYYGAFGDAPPEVSYEGCAVVDDTHFEVTYSKAYWGEAPFKVVLKLELQEGRLIVTAQEKAA